MPFLPADPAVVLLTLGGLILSTMVYIRILRRGHRRGDGAASAQIELVGSEYDP